MNEDRNLNRIIEKTIGEIDYERTSECTGAPPNSDVSKELVQKYAQILKTRLMPWLASVLADNHGFDLDPAAPETKGFEDGAARYIDC